MALSSQLDRYTPRLSAQQYVPRALVHKHALENVLLTGINRCGDDRFVCAGRVPTDHGFFNDAGRTPQTDILFYTELGRQASLAISHAYLGVNPDDVFIFERSQAAVTPAAWHAVAHTPFEEIVVEVAIGELARRRNNAVNRVVADHIMWIGGKEVFRGTGAWSIQPAALFQRLRRSGTTHRESPTAVRPSGDSAAGADRLQSDAGDNVVISCPAYAGETGAFISSLIVDQTHPYFFDHPCDHVPGMLLLEGCAQLALAACRETAGVRLGTAVIGSYDVNFSQFVECGPETTLTARLTTAAAAGVAPACTVQVTIGQETVESGTTTMTVAFPV